MKKSKTAIVTTLLMIGLLLAGAKLFYMFFDKYNIVDLIVFVGAGMLWGGKVPPYQKILGMLLCVPAFAVSLLFVINLGYKSILQGIGTAFAISLIVIPAATFIGLSINRKLALRKSLEKRID